MIFADRTDAGIQLGELLSEHHVTGDVVLGLARGGVPVAAEVARILNLPLDVLVVRKLGAPHQPEFALGALAEDGTTLVDDRVMSRLGVSQDYLEAVKAEQALILHHRVSLLRRDRPELKLTDAAVIIVDDGLATGLTARVACAYARNQGARRIVLAVPVAARDTLAHLTEADQVITLSSPEEFSAVGAFYEDFTQVTDEQARALLDEADDHRS